MPGDAHLRPRARAQARRAAALSALGAWTVVVPYLGRALGLDVDVAPRIEVVDHVVPGALVAAVAALMAVRAGAGRVADLTALLGGGVCFLAGFWVLATHVPLLADAAGAGESWATALWHASTGLPIVLASLWITLGQAPDRDRVP